MQKGRIQLRFAGINAIIADHFEMLFRYVTDQTIHEFQDGNGFGNQLIIFVAIVMEGDEITIIAINA